MVHNNPFSITEETLQTDLTITWVGNEYSRYRKNETDVALMRLGSDSIRDARDMLTKKKHNSRNYVTLDCDLQRP